ncbi:MAG: DUF6541 family protein [bacterium]
MDHLTPFSDLPGFLAWLAGFLLLTAGPGFALAGHRLAGQDRFTRLLASLATGMLAFPLLGHAMSFLQIPLTPAYYALVVMGLAVVLDRSRRYRMLWQEVGAGIPPLGGLALLGALAGGAALAVVIQQAFAGFAASPHLHDASNHSFMVRQIVEHASLDRRLVFGPPYGSPPQDYLLGWHAGAALISRLTGALPHVSAWYLAAACACLLPAMGTLVWRAFGIPGRIMGLGAGFLAANYFMPTGIFSWGGYGQIIGLFALPWAVVLLRNAARPTGWPAGLAAGLALLGLLHVHTAEVFAVLILAPAAWPRGADRARWRSSAPRLALAAGVLVVGGLLPLLPTFTSYNAFTAGHQVPPPPGWKAAWQQFTTFAGGNVPILQLMIGPALLAGVFRKGMRRVWVTSLVMTLLFLGLRQVQDPVSLLLTRPFYHQAGRLLYPQIFLMPLLVSGLFFLAVDGMGTLWSRLRWPGRTAIQVGLVLIIAARWLYPGCYWSYRNMLNFTMVAPFSVEDARLAERMQQELPPSAVVANQDNDGSFWAMHLSGLRFLDPCTWDIGVKEGRCYRGPVAHLLDDPWPQQTIALRELGTRYLFVSDTALPDSRHPINRDHIGADPRFREVMRGGDSAVYEILWDQASLPQP